MSEIINARSPYFLKYTNATNILTNVKVELKIWSGLKTDVPTEIDYTITKQPLVAEVGNYVVFEISELIRDFLQTDYYTEAIDAVWVEAKVYRTFSSTPIVSTEIYLAFDGWGNFGGGANPRQTTTPMILQSNKKIQFVRGRDIKIPVFAEFEPTVETEIPLGVWNFVEDFWENSDPTWDQTSTDLDIIDSDDSRDKIQYVVISTNNALSGDTITFTSTQGTPTTVVITIEEVCEPKYDAIRGIFYNKFGALQTMWFPNKSKEKQTSRSESYNANTINYDAPNVEYSFFKHNKKRFNIVSGKTISVNTSLLDELFNIVIKELLYSESCWLEKPLGNTLETRPVNLLTKNFTRKTSVNDKVDVQYNLDFEYSYEQINNVR